MSESEYLKEIRFVAYWSMKSGASYENSCLVSKKNIFVNNIQGIAISRAVSSPEEIANTALTRI